MGTETCMTGRSNLSAENSALIGSLAIPTSSPQHVDPLENPVGVVLDLIEQNL